MSIAWPIAVYVVAFAVLAVVEGYAIGDRKRGNTISEVFWSLRASPAVWAVVPLITWTAFHFTMPYEPDGRAWNDWCYLAIGLALAVWNVVYQMRRKADR